MKEIYVQKALKDQQVDLASALSFTFFPDDFGDSHASEEFFSIL